MKASEVYMKRFLFYEKGSDNFKEKIEKSIIQAIKDKFLAETAEYVMAENIADNQNKFYLIEQSAKYKPFDFLNESEENKFISNWRLYYFRRHIIVATTFWI